MLCVGRLEKVVEMRFVPFIVGYKLVGLASLSLGMDLPFVSPFTGTKIDPVKVTRFKGKTSAEVITTLRTEKIQFAFLPRTKGKTPDPRNTDFSAEQLTELQAYVEEGQKAKVNLLGVECIAFLAPRWSHQWSPTQNKWVPLPKNNHFTILFILDPEEEPDFEASIHEYVHALFEEAALPNPIFRDKNSSEKHSRYDSINFWIRFRENAYRDAVNTYNALTGKDETQRLALANVCSTWLESQMSKITATRFSTLQEVDAHWFLATVASTVLGGTAEADNIARVTEYARMIDQLKTSIEADPAYTRVMRTKDTLAKKETAPAFANYQKELNTALGLKTFIEDFIKKNTSE